MTKEEELELEIYKRLDGDGNIKKVLDKFFSQNVCIPKGENRHRNADILHEIAENPDKHLQMQHKSNMYDWNTFDLYTNYVFRIKPLGLIYEYKWYIGNMYGIDAVTEQFHTEEEIKGKPFRKMRETKQERK